MRQYESHQDCRYAEYRSKYRNLVRERTNPVQRDLPII